MEHWQSGGKVKLNPGEVEERRSEGWKSGEVWKGRGLERKSKEAEERRSGKPEEWKSGGVEEQGSGRVQEWKSKKMVEWRSGRAE